MWMVAANQWTEQSKLVGLVLIVGDTWRLLVCIINPVNRGPLAVTLPW